MADNVSTSGSIPFEVYKSLEVIMRHHELDWQDPPVESGLPYQITTDLSSLPEDVRNLLEVYEREKELKPIVTVVSIPQKNVEQPLYFGFDADYRFAVVITGYGNFTGGTYTFLDQLPDVSTYDDDIAREFRENPLFSD